MGQMPEAWAIRGWLRVKDSGSVLGCEENTAMLLSVRNSSKYSLLEEKEMEPRAYIGVYVVALVRRLSVCLFN